MENIQIKNFLTLNVIISLIFLASNSVLCKLAFLNNGIDPFSFTAIRLLSAAITLFILINVTQESQTKGKKGSVILGLMLFLYAICFSYSYVLIDTGIGALILFGTVQITMMGYAIFKKDVTVFKLIGTLIALFGLVILLLPHNDYVISTQGFILMAIAGVAWGIYSILGKNSQNPLQITYTNFSYSVGFLILFSFFIPFNFHINTSSFLFALLSGGLTSGLGYVLWYKVIKQLHTTTASIVQLSVPVLSTIGGVIFLKEQLTFQLILATIIILSGIAISSLKKGRQ
jgi:drug/metabolite transporter (DMT)-like permease